jgi:hypothetical protein
MAKDKLKIVDYVKGEIVTPPNPEKQKGGQDNGNNDAQDTKKSIKT